MAASVLYTWLCNNTRGSILFAILLHATNNTAGMFLPSSFAAVGGIMSNLMVVVYISADIVVTFIAGPSHLPRTEEKQIQKQEIAIQQFNAKKLDGVSTIDFPITAKGSQACPYCWGPRCLRDPVDTDTAQLILARIKDLGVRRVVFIGGDPLQRPDAPDLIRSAKEIGLETALSTARDFVMPEILESVSPYLDLILLPLDGSTEEINSRTKYPGQYVAVMRSLEWLRSYPNIDIKVCTPVTRHNLNDVLNIAGLVEGYSYATKARVFYNVFQAFPRAMFSIRSKLIVRDEEFSSLKDRVPVGTSIRINFLSHEALDKLYVIIFPDGSMTIPRGGEYLNSGPFLEAQDFDHVLNVSQFNSAKHLRHSRGWGKGSLPVGEFLDVNKISVFNTLNV